MNTEDPVDATNARKLRPRRSVLTDISNKIADKFADVTKKVTSKKRKLSVSKGLYFCLKQ